MKYISILKENKILQILYILGLSLSLSFLSVYLIIGNISKLIVIITFILTFIITNIFIYINRKTLCNSVLNNKLNIIISLIIGIIIFIEFKLLGRTSIDNVKYLFTHHLPKQHYLIIPGLIFIITIIFNYIKLWIIDLYNKLDKYDKRIYLIVSILLFIIIYLLYSLTNKFYMSYDTIYSIDSKWVYEGIFMNPNYYDIRHPLLSIITFPIYSIINFIFSNNLQPVLLQFINVQLLLLIGLELKIMTNKRIVLIFYLLSFTSILFFLFLEKYVICTFLVVTYLYNTYNKKQSSVNLSLVGGSMPTSSYIGITELFKEIPLKEKINNILKVLLIFICLLICTGRLHVFTNGFEELKYSKDTYSAKGYNVVEKVDASISMIEHCLVGIKSKEIKDKFLWNDVTKRIPIIGLLILIVIPFGFKDFKKDNKLLFYSFLTTLIFSFILIVLLNWAVFESPLFSIMFSWSIIPLFIYGIDNIMNRLNVNKKNYKYIYTVLIICMLLKDIPVLINLFKYIF